MGGPARQLRGRVDPVLAGLGVVAAVLYAAWSLRRHAHWASSGFDLGIFDQVVWHFSRLEAPGSSIKDLDWIWGDHLSPVLALFAPLYWVWADPRALLVAQAILVAAGAVPVFLAARDVAGRGVARALSGAYLVFWGVQSAVTFDVHEVAFAPLALGGTLLAARRRAWRWYWPGVLLTLCVKEDLAFVVVALGACVALGGDRRTGALTALAGAAWYLGATELVIPHFARGGDFTYWSYDAFGSGPLDALGGVARRPWRLVTVALDDPQKVRTLALLLLPFGLLCLLAREAVLLVPLLGERFWSGTENYWGTSAHYSLTVAVVLAIGTAAGIARVGGWVGPAHRRRVAGALAGLVLAANVAIGATFPVVEHLLDGEVPGALPGRAAAARAVAVVPDGASVATVDGLIDRLTHRDVAAEITPRTGLTDFVVADLSARRPEVARLNGSTGGVGRFLDARLLQYRPVFYEDGWVVLEARARSPRRTPALAPMSPADQARAEPVLQRWYEASAARRRALDGCLTSGAPCPGAGARAGAGPAGGRTASIPAPGSDAAVQRLLGDLAPRLSPGCRELAGLAATATAAERSALDPPLPAGDPAARATRARLLADQDGGDVAGFLVRFQALCSPRTA